MSNGSKCVRIHAATEGLAKLLGASFLGASLSLLAQTEDWTPELVQTSDAGFRRADESIVVRLPTLPQEVLQTLAIELDTNDVTGLARLSDDGQHLELVAESPLQPGLHSLRLVELDADGNLIERGVWQFEVRQSALFEKTQSSHGLSLDGSQRAAARDESAEASSFETNGSTRSEFMMDTGRRVHSGHLELLYDGNAGQTGAPRDIDAGDFLVSSSSDISRLSVGHHFPGPIVGTSGSSLIFDGGSRRGISGGLAIPGWPTNFMAFALRTDSITGFQKGLGIGDSRNRIDGLMFDTLIYASGDSRVKLGLGHVKGAGEQGGTAVGDPAAGIQVVDPGDAGDASSLFVEGLLADGQIAARAELARTTRDVGFGIGDIDDDGYALMFAYQPRRGPTFADMEMTWNVSLDHQKIGGLFHSIAYPGSSVDVEMTQINAGAQLGGLSAQLFLSRGEDNVNDFDIPTTQSQTQSLGLNYSPQLEEETMPTWLRQPSIALMLGRDGRKFTSLPATSMATPVDVDTNSGSLSLSFAHPYGGWGLSYSPTRIKDHTGAFGSQKSRSVSLDSSFTVSPRYSVTPQVSLDRSTDESNGVTAKTTSYVIGQQLAIIADVLDLGLSLGRNITRLSDNTQDTTSHNADLSLGWNTPYVKGLSLWLRGSYYESKDTGTAFQLQQMMDPFAVSGDKDHQIFVGFNYQLQTSE